MNDESASWPQTVLDDLPLLWEVVSHYKDEHSVLRYGLSFKHARDMVKFYRYAAHVDVAITMQPMGAVGRA